MHSYKNPDEYSKNNSLQFNFAMEVISHTEIPEDTRLLDLGCGDGLLTKKIADFAKKGCVIGTDISEKMVDHANKTYISQSNLRFIQMDSSKNFFRSQFDVVTSFNSLHWVKDQASALSGISNALIENGKAVLLLSHKKSHYHNALDVICKNEKWNKYFKDYINPRSFFEVNEYQKLTEDAGLKIASLTEKEMVHRYDSVEKFKAFLSASMANIKQIPDSLKNEFLDDFCAEFFKLSSCRNLNNIPVGFWCLEITAIKPNRKKENILAQDASRLGFLRSKL